MEEPSFKERIKELQEMINNPEKAEKFIQEETLLQDAFGFSEDQMQQFYQFARGLCEQERFEDASDVFLVLSSLNPFVSHFWLGLGLCDKVAGRFKEALFDYSMALAVDKENPYTYYNIADCYSRLDECRTADDFIDICLEICKGVNDYTSLEMEAKVFKQQLKGKLN